MRDVSEIRTIVFRAIDRVNEVLSDGSMLAKDPALKLLGDGGALDSMGFVNFVVALEEELAAQGVRMNLVGELNDTRNASSKPATVGEFIDFIFHLLRTNTSASS